MTSGTRTLALAVCLCAAISLLPSVAVDAQRARVSPHETTNSVVEGSKISIEYGRPYKKGRDIWGALVPWGRWWMPGADEATILTTADTLVLGDLTVPAGRHTIYMWVDQKAPKLIINKEVGQFHTVYHPDQDLGRVELTLTMLKEPVEQLTFEAEARSEGGGILKLIWDNREYSVPFTIKR